MNTGRRIFIGPSFRRSDFHDGSLHSFHFPHIYIETDLSRLIPNLLTLSRVQDPGFRPSHLFPHFLDASSAISPPLSHATSTVSATLQLYPRAVSPVPGHTKRRSHIRNRRQRNHREWIHLLQWAEEHTGNIFTLTNADPFRVKNYSGQIPWVCVGGRST